MPSGAVTLLELAKTMADPMQRAVVGTYTTEYHPTTVMPLSAAPTGAYQWYLESSLPFTTGGVRNLNGSWTSTHGINLAKSETIRIYGGQVKIDRQMAKINPAGVADQQAKQIKAAARVFAKDFFEGTDGSALRGLDDWLDNEAEFAGQSVAVGTSTTAAVITNDHLDEMVSKINRVPGMTFFYCTDTVERRIRKISRGTAYTSDSINVPFNVVYSPEQLGYFAGAYAGIPIIVMKDGKGTDLLTKTRATSANGSHIYLVTYGPENLTGFQLNPMEVIPQKDETVYDYFTIEWPVGVAPQSIRCIARGTYVKDALA